MARRPVRRMLLSIFLPLAWTGCGGESDWEAVLSSIRAEFPEVRQIDTARLAEWLAEPGGRSILLLDARSPAEFQVSHLPGAVLLTPALEQELARSRDERILVVYCSVGWRSSQAVRRLMSTRAFPVYNLEGSIFKWANEGRPVYQEERRVQSVHPYDSRWGRLLQRHLHCCLEAQSSTPGGS